MFLSMNVFTPSVRLICKCSLHAGLTCNSQRHDRLLRICNWFTSYHVHSVPFRLKASRGLEARGQNPRGRGHNPRGRGRGHNPRGRGRGQVFRPRGRGQASRPNTPAWYIPWIWSRIAFTMYVAVWGPSSFNELTTSRQSVRIVTSFPVANLFARFSAYRTAAHSTVIIDKSSDSLELSLIFKDGIW